VQIDPVEQWTTDFSQVPLNNPACASAFARGIAEKSARAPVQVATDLKVE
jgi:hypothetical protein